MSEKCKTLTMPFGETGFGEEQVRGTNGCELEGGQTVTSPADGFRQANVCCGGRVDRGVAVFAGRVGLAPDARRRLAAIAQVEVVCGSSEIIHSRQSLVPVWSRVLKELLRPLANRGCGQILRRSAVSAAFEFRSTMAAVHWAMAAQDQVEHRAVADSEQRLGLRIDIDVGEFADLTVRRPGESHASVGWTPCSRRAGEIWLTRKAQAFVTADVEFLAPQAALGNAAPWQDQEPRLIQVRRLRKS